MGSIVARCSANRFSPQWSRVTTSLEGSNKDMNKHAFTYTQMSARDAPQKKKDSLTR